MFNVIIKRHIYQKTGGVLCGENGRLIMARGGYIEKADILEGKKMDLIWYIKVNESLNGTLK